MKLGEDLEFVLIKERGRGGTELGKTYCCKSKDRPGLLGRDLVIGCCGNDSEKFAESRLKSSQGGGQRDWGSVAGQISKEARQRGGEKNRTQRHQDGNNSKEGRGKVSQRGYGELGDWHV